MRKAVLLIALAIAAAVAVGAGIRLGSSTKTQAVSPASPAQVVRPLRRPAAVTVNATGTVRLRVGSEVRVGSQLSGIVKRLHVTVGSHVARGSLIAEIDDRSVRARLAQAEAQAAWDRATLEKSRVDSKRGQQLLSEGLASPQQAEDLALALREAEAKYEKSLRDRDAVRVDASYVLIRAPISGTIATVSTQEGETVAAALAAPTFVTIIGDRALQLVAMVDETDIAGVHPGDPVTFSVDSYPSRDFAGTVISIAPRATIVSGVVNYEVTIEIVRDAELLKPDMTANVTVRTARRESQEKP